MQLRQLDERNQSAPLEQPLGLRTPKASPALSLPAKYKPVRVIGTGAMGVVTLARDPSLGRLVAIKTLRTDCGDLLARLREEAALLARLEHPSIVRVHALDVHGGSLYLTMEYLAGGNLALTRFEPVELVQKLRGVVDALAHAHAHGVVHRDVKPENILLTGRGASGRAVLADFGLALGPGEGSAALRQPIAGTPLTMSPEQLAGAPLGPASDIFSLGVTLYRQLTGSWPFRGRTLPDVFDAIRERQVAPLRQLHPGIPRRLDAIVRKTLAKDPALRFSSMQELGRALDAFLRARSVFAFFSRPAGDALQTLTRRQAKPKTQIHPEDQR